MVDCQASKVRNLGRWFGVILAVGEGQGHIFILGE
jgi:hypothetical protein